MGQPYRGLTVQRVFSPRPSGGGVPAHAPVHLRSTRDRTPARHNKPARARRGHGTTPRRLTDQKDEDGRPMSDIAERVKKIVVEHLGVEPEKVVESANFIDDLGADSLDTVELVMAFEEEFNVEIPDDAAETIQTVGDAVKFL